MNKKVIRGLFGTPRRRRFDAVFQGTDFELLDDLVGRIEGPRWETEHIMSLSTSEAHLCRMCRFDGIFGNGGLHYWFECDSEHYWRHTCSAFMAIGLEGAADALGVAYSAFPSAMHFSNWDLRMETLESRSAIFEPLDEILWAVHHEIEPRTAAYVRQNKSNFERLRDIRPWCSLREEYGDA